MLRIGGNPINLLFPPHPLIQGERGRVPGAQDIPVGYMNEL